MSNFEWLAFPPTPRATLRFRRARARLQTTCGNFRYTFQRTIFPLLARRIDDIFISHLAKSAQICFDMPANLTLRWSRPSPNWIKVKNHPRHPAMQRRRSHAGPPAGLLGAIQPTTPADPDFVCWMRSRPTRSNVRMSVRVPGSRSQAKRASRPSTFESPGRPTRPLQRLIARAVSKLIEAD